MTLRQVTEPEARWRALCDDCWLLIYITAQLDVPGHQTEPVGVESPGSQVAPELSERFGEPKFGYVEVLIIELRH